MGHSDHFLPDFNDLHYLNGNFMGQHHSLDLPCDVAGYDLFSKPKDPQPHYYQNNSAYPAIYSPTPTAVHDEQDSGQFCHANRIWLGRPHFGGVLESTVALPSSKPTFTSPDGTSSSFSPSVSPNSSAVLPSYLDEPWNISPASVTTDTDDDSSLASSLASLSPDSFDLDKILGKISVEDEDDDNNYLHSPVSPGSNSIYHSLEEYPQHTSPHADHHEGLNPAVHLNDDSLSPLTFSPPGLTSLRLLSLPKSEHQSTSALNIKDSPVYNPSLPLPSYDFHPLFNYDSSTPIPYSPSRRRSSTLPKLEPSICDADPVGLREVSPVFHSATLPSLPAEVPTSFPSPPSGGADMGMPNPRWRSLPGCETDDDLIPLDLASKNYIPDPSIIVPTTSTGTRSLLLWDNGCTHDPDHGSISRSPSPENFYLDLTVLAEYGDEEMQKVYELRQRTAKSEKWERERCRELSALLRLKLDERGVLGGGGSGDYGSTVYHPQSYSTSSSSSPSPSSLSSSNWDSFPVHTPFSSSTLLSTSGKPEAEPEGPKHKIRSMAQLVASMFFHRQNDDLRRHLSGKTRFGSTSSHSHYYLHPTSMGSTGINVLPKPRSRLSQVILPEELELDSELGAGQEVESGHGDEEGGEDVGVGVDDKSLSMDAGLKRDVGIGSHTVTCAAPGDMYRGW